MGEIVKMSFEGKSWQHLKEKAGRKLANGLKAYDSEKIWTLGAGQFLYKSRPLNYLDLFYGKVNIGGPCI